MEINRIKNGFITNDVISLFKSMDFIDSVLGDDSYYGDAYNNCDTGDYDMYVVQERALDLEYNYGIKYINSGFARAVFDLNNNYVAKIQLNEDDCSSDREFLLYNYVKRNKPKLAEFLLPPLCKINNVLIMPYCKSPMHIPTFYVKCICNLFKKNGIHLEDIEGRADNWGIYNKRYVIRDYGIWEFIRSNSYEK